MPLKKICSIKAYEVNVAELIRSGYPPQQAVAIAHSTLRQACRVEGKPTPRISTNRADSALPEPPKEVLDFLKDKKLKPSWSWLDVWREEHAAAFTVAGVMENDILVDLKLALGDALREGLPFAEFKKRITPILADKGWLARTDVIDPITGDEKDVVLGEPMRLRTIFDTNLRMARAAGQWGRIEATKDVLPYLIYMHGPSRVPRPDHLALDGIILPADHPLWRTHYPPNGFGCLCSVRQASEREVRSKGGVSRTPKTPLVEWKNGRTGKSVWVPKGCDPGFDYNVGIERLRGLK